VFNLSMKKQQTPRIAIVRHSRYPDDMHVRRDAMALRDAGFDVDLVCDREPGRPAIERVDGITVLRIPPRHRRGGLARYAFEYLAFPLVAAGVIALRSLGRRYTWIEINNMPDWLVIAALFPKAFGAKVTLYSREDMARLFASDHDLPSTHRVIRLLEALEGLSARVADRVIVSQELARRDFLVQGTPPRKVVVVPNVPDEKAFRAQITPSTHDHRGRADGDDAFRLVTHGTLTKRYGIETLIEAVSIVRKEIPGVRLEIIGSGEYRQELEALTHRLHLESQVTFTGYLPSYEDVAPRLMEADVGVVALWTDFQLCNKLTEYLALGMPTITTESAALRPYLDDGEVYYVEPKNARALADAITTLYRDSARRAALAEAGHLAYLRHFTWDDAREKYLAVYRDDLEPRSEAPCSETPYLPEAERTTA